jgi:putative ABC transport system permease protein
VNGPPREVAEGTTTCGGWRFGLFTTSTPIPAADADRVAATPGVVRADPLVVLHSTLRRPSVRDVNVIGARPGGLGMPPTAEGRAVARLGEVVADTALGLGLGDRVELGGLDLEVVGLADQVTWYFGTPMVFVAIQDAQALGFDGQPLAMTIITQGVPRSAPAGLRVLSDTQAWTDLERPLASATQSIAFINALLWLVAAGIIGSIVYLSALERQREFAVLKATGAANRSLLAGLALQAVLLSAAAAVLAAGIARLLAPGFPFTVEIPSSAFPRLLGVAVAVGLAASAAGLRRAVGVQPALAFGGAMMDRIDIGIRDLTITYASGGYVVRPIHHLDLQVASGELVLLLGASGSGRPPRCRRWRRSCGPRRAPSGWWARSRSPPCAGPP